MNNHTQMPIKLPKGRFDWNKFDALPREVRDAINNAAFRYSYSAKCPREQARKLADHIRKTDAQAVAAAYARRDAELELKELGL